MKQLFWSFAVPLAIIAFFLCSMLVAMAFSYLQSRTMTVGRRDEPKQ